MYNCPESIYQNRTFLSAVAMGLSAVIVALLIACTAVILYGMRLAATDPDGGFLSFAQQAVHWFPGARKALPFSLANVPVSCRQPEYCSHIQIAAETRAAAGTQTDVKTVVRVANEGSEAISLLLLRIVIFNSRREVLAESTEWAATGVAAQSKWRGPLLPGCHRYIAVSPVRVPPGSLQGRLQTEVEIADIRISPSQKQTWLADSRPAARKQ